MNTTITRPENHRVGIQAAALAVTLTATSNPYLIDRLPLEGIIELNEVSLDGHLMGATTFRVRNEDGSLTAPVMVFNAEFEYRR